MQYQLPGSLPTRQGLSWWQRSRCNHREVPKQRVVCGTLSGPFIAPLVLVVKSLCFVNSLRICIFAGCAFGSGLQGWLSVVSQQSPSLCLSCCTRIWLLQCVPMLHHSKRSALHQHRHASVDGFLSFEAVVGGAVELHRIALPSINSV